MTFKPFSVSCSGLALILLGLGAGSSQASSTNSVSNVGFSAYSINGVNNPTLTLMRGVTYLFNINAPGHPFWLKTIASTGTANAYTTGVTGNGVQVGTLTFVVPTNAPNTLFYNCQYHSPMTGTLNIIDSPSPPIVRIVSFEVGQGVVVKSTGATGWKPVPEYCCSAPATNWTAVSPFTNVFANGTNTTTFDRFAAPCGPGVFFRIREQAN